MKKADMKREPEQKHDFKCGEIDPLTGLYIWRTFFNKAGQALAQTPANQLCMTVLDIQNFPVFNKFYGREQGDVLLSKIGALLLEVCQETGGIASYLGADNFVLLMPNDVSLIERLHDGITDLIHTFHNNAGFSPVFGLCTIDDPSEPAATLYDRALLALFFAKRAGKNEYCKYTPDMEPILEEPL